MSIGYPFVLPVDSENRLWSLSWISKLGREEGIDGIESLGPG